MATNWKKIALWVFRAVLLISIAYGIEKMELNAILGIVVFFVFEGIIALVSPSWFKK